VRHRDSGRSKTPRASRAGGTAGVIGPSPTPREGVDWAVAAGPEAGVSRADSLHGPLRVVTLPLPPKPNRRTARTAARGRAAAAPQVQRSRRSSVQRVGGPAPQPLLVATADPSLARMLAFALDQVRLPFVTFTSGTVVLKELLAMPPTASPPIVVLDVDLPGVDGHAILERLGVERPNAFLIIVLSSHADESVQVRSLLAGALDHLAKPFNVRVLLAKLQRWTSVAAGIRRELI